MPVRPLHLLLSCTALTGCAYRAGSYENGSGVFPGTRTTAGCLDLAVAVVPHAPKPGPVLQFNFGNRCTRPVPLDFTALRVIARDDTGFERPLVPFDPRGELRPLMLEAALSAREMIEFRDPYGVYFSNATSTICVDLGGITPDTSSVAPVCMAAVAEARP